MGRERDGGEGLVIFVAVHVSKLDTSSPHLSVSPFLSLSLLYIAMNCSSPYL